VDLLWENGLWGQQIYNDSPPALPAEPALLLEPNMPAEQEIPVRQRCVGSRTPPLL